MPHARRLLPLLLLPLSALAARPASPAAIGPTRHAAAADTIPPDNFDVERIAEGVYAVIRREPAGLWFDANNVFIIDDEGVMWDPLESTCRHASLSIL